MPQPAPTLAFVCGVCRHALDMICPVCLAAEQETKDADWLNHHRADQEAKAEEDAARRAVPGVVALEDLFDVPVSLVPARDEDGPGGWSAKLSLPGLEICDGEGETEAEAVADLRVEIVKELRITANHLETEAGDVPLWALSLDDAEVHTLLFALAAQHSDPALGPKAVALTEKLCRQTGAGRDEVPS